MTEPHGGNVYRAARMAGFRADQIIDFSANINPRGFPPGLRQAVMAALDDCVRYPDPAYGDLRAVLSRHSGIDAERIVPGNGAMELLGLALRAMAPRRALVLAPSFGEYGRILRAGGSDIEYCHLREENGFAPDADEIAARLSGCDLAVICNPNNPTGGYLAPPAVERLCAAAALARCRVLVDESFIDFVGPNGASAGALVDAYPGLVIVRSLTKFYGIPGLRLGYCASGDPAFVEQLTALRDPWSVNTLAAAAAPALLADGGFADETRALIEREREFLMGSLGSLGWVRPYPSRANFILVRIVNGRTAAAVREDCLRQRVLIRDASNFTSLDDSWFRVAIRDRAANMMLLGALREAGLRDGAGVR